MFIQINEMLNGEETFSFLTNIFIKLQYTAMWTKQYDKKLNEIIKK